MKREWVRKPATDRQPLRGPGSESGARHLRNAYAEAARLTRENASYLRQVGHGDVALLLDDRAALIDKWVGQFSNEG